MSQNNGQQTLESMGQATWYNNWLLKKFEPYLKGEILEVGCGIGNFTQTLAKYGQVTAIDINKNYLNKTKREVKDQALVGFGDIEKNHYFFKKKKFDSIVCMNVLEHIEKDTQALKNLINLLKPHGYLILIVPSHQALYGSIDKAIDHFRRYEKNKLVKLIKQANFKVVNSKKLNLLGALGWYFSGKVLQDQGVNQGKIKIFNILGPVPIFFERFIEPPFGLSILLIAQK